MDKIYRKFIFLLIVLALLAPFLFFRTAGINLNKVLFVFAEENDIEKSCQTLIEETEATCKDISREQCQVLLNECLEFYQEQSDYYGGKVAQTEQEKKTLQNQIYILRNKVSRLNNEIYSSNLMIKDLNLQIGDTQVSITVSSSRIYDSKEKLAELLRLIYEQDQRSLIEIMLAEEELSDFFDELAALEALSLENQELLGHIKTLKQQLEEGEQALSSERGDLENLVAVNILQRQQSSETKEEQEYFLRLTETEYQKYLKEQQESQAMAAEINSRIFDLIGVVGEHTFGELYQIAKHYIEPITGVRPALLLAVIKQESNLGKNVGQCYLTNPDTGAGIVSYNNNKISRVMSPTRDVPHFLKITKELGRDPYQTLVSCPMSYGWGGAMGPAQFIPSTWVIYREKAKEITGKPADPWVIKDAFLASALYLSDNGASDQTYNQEWRAAMIYFSGSTNVKYRFYGDSVMATATQYAKDIAVLEQ